MIPIITIIDMCSKHDCHLNSHHLRLYFLIGQWYFPDGTSKNRLIACHANQAVHKIVMPDANEVLTAGEDGCVMRADLRDTKSSEQLLLAKGKDGKIPLYSIAHHPFDPEFCICGRDKFVRVYDKRNVKECSKMFCPDHILKRTVSCDVYTWLIIAC